MSNKILVLNGMGYKDALLGLGEFTGSIKEFMENPLDFSLVLFTGGADITPSWYGHTSPDRWCQYNEDRDIEEKGVFDVALKHGIRMAGICRGLQFLNVMAGGTMIHHVTAHGGIDHMMATKNGDVMRVNSYHHQMVMPPEDAVVIGWSEVPRSDIYLGDEDKRMPAPGKEVEAVIYPKIGAVGAQYHPEWMAKTSEGYKWYKDLVECLITEKNMADVVEKYTRNTPWSTTHAG